MDKTTLHKIFSSAYNHEKWLEVLQSVFGSKQLFSQPKPILLPNNDRTSGAFELGNLTTSDDRIIGLYRIDVKPEVWLERNKVSLRELLRNVYKYDVDGAIVVFVQEEKWRLSFISEIKVLNDEGEVVKQATEPKRYTYLLGEDEKVRTASDRLGKMSGKLLSLQDILNAFSVEALNEEFYKIVQNFFYKLVGGHIGQGKKSSDFGEGILQLPSTLKEYRQTYQEFSVRLIGRTVFCWFLKKKKSEFGKPLLPENLLSSLAVKGNNDYYHSILERLFFQTLNTPMEERTENLPSGSEIVPFLNGGLFEPGIEDFYKPNKITGLNENLNTLKIDDQWFIQFFEELEKYNFTIDENSVTEVEVSVDPEMLGRIFENLLAEIDPDSGETARKATGSFYTPREIVDYMATESLVRYLHNKTTIEEDKLRPIFKMLEQEDPKFSKYEKENILDALDKVKILDPACGSGAFPMGVLQKIVQALQKLDKDASWWKKRQVDRISNAIVKKQLKEKLESSGVEYARKIGIIQNSLYGVDIQPVAAEISKLRCFLSLIVDENIDENKPNRGIEPLPNLEFKFVTADTLRKLPESDEQRALFDNFEELQELEELRDEYIQSYGKAKQRLKDNFLKVQQKVTKDQLSLFANQNSKAYKIGNWNPFGHEKSDWLDPKWMFGVEKFDVVIGNPPFVLLQNTSLSLSEQEELRKEYTVAQYKTDLFHLFIERGISLAKNANGILCYITPNTYLKNKHNDLLREFMVTKTHINKIIRFSVPIFKNASVDNAITITENGTDINNEISVIDVSTTPFNIENRPPKRVRQDSITPNDYVFNFDIIDNKHLSIIKRFPKLKQYGRAYFGIQTFDRKTYVSKEKINNLYLPVVDGTNVTRYFLKKYHEYVCFESNAIKSGGNQDVYKKDRILVRQIGKFPEGCFCPSEIYTLNTIYNIYTTTEAIKLKFLLGIINSKLIQFYWLMMFFDNKETFPKIKKEPLESLPIIPATEAQQNIIINIVDYILLLKNCVNNVPINEFVSNTHIAQLFEEVIDAIVMELYFKEDFEIASIEFIKYAKRDFESIEGKSELEQIEIIHKAYQKLREKDNEIRNNLKLMDIKLADIVMPIKTAK